MWKKLFYSHLWETNNIAEYFWIRLVRTEYNESKNINYFVGFSLILLFVFKLFSLIILKELYKLEPHNFLSIFFFCVYELYTTKINCGKKKILKGLKYVQLKIQ